MFRSRRFVKPVLALIAIGAVALVASGCALVKPGSVTVSQPQGIGSVRVHFALCTIGGSFCGPNEENESIQYLAGIAAPPGSVPPASFTAAPIGGGTPIVFTRNEEVAPEIAASSVVLQKTLSEATSPEEKEEAEELKPTDRRSLAARRHAGIRLPLHARPGSQRTVRGMVGGRRLRPPDRGGWRPLPGALHNRHRLGFPRNLGRPVGDSARPLHQGPRRNQTDGKRILLRRRRPADPACPV